MLTALSRRSSTALKSSRIFLIVIEGLFGDAHLRPLARPLPFLSAMWEAPDRVGTHFL